MTESIISRTKKVFDKPSRGKSTLVDAGDKALENEKFLEEYRIDYVIFRKEEKKYKEAWVKAYVLIWDSYCSREIQTAIKEKSTFETKIKDEPIALLEMIEMLMHTPEKAKYPSLTLIEVLLSFTKIKQGKNEELIDYLSRFKTERDIMFRLLGRGLIDGFTEKLPIYLAVADNAARKEIKRKEFGKMMSVLFLRNANHERFGELLVEYRKAYANKDIKYLQNLSNMMDVMRQQPIRKRKTSPIKSPEIGEGKG